MVWWYVKVVCEILIYVVYGRFDFHTLGSSQSEMSRNFQRDLHEFKDNLSKIASVSSILSNFLRLILDHTATKTQPVKRFYSFGANLKHRNVGHVL